MDIGSVDLALMLIELSDNNSNMSLKLDKVENVTKDINILKKNGCIDLLEVLENLVLN